MKENIETYKTISIVDCKVDDYSYQDLLTPKLDSLNVDFDQAIINEIVLWKVNRYASILPETLALINEIDKEDRTLDKDITWQVLKELLVINQKGIRLAMASTILRFKNPHIYQIIDQRVYRFIFGKELKYSLTNVESQLEVYLEYLEKLREVCQEIGIQFSEADRILYMMDKKYNSDKKLKY